MGKEPKTLPLPEQDTEVRSQPAAPYLFCGQKVQHEALESLSVTTLGLKRSW